ncbi:hypothetical protein AAHZ94_13190 [Streptomyces sp. HSW2009]|uniref:hypothetical protein n=1 Tax=Streptomyces sp. HSW2009 TaxID=3142890 RepID=UPI0032EE6DBC
MNEDDRSTAFVPNSAGRRPDASDALVDALLSDAHAALGNAVTNRLARCAHHNAHEAALDVLLSDAHTALGNAVTNRLARQARGQMDDAAWDAVLTAAREHRQDHASPSSDGPPIEGGPSRAVPPGEPVGKAEEAPHHLEPVTDVRALLQEWSAVERLRNRVLLLDLFRQLIAPHGRARALALEFSRTHARGTDLNRLQALHRGLESTRSWLAEQAPEAADRGLVTRLEQVIRTMAETVLGLQHDVLCGPPLLFAHQIAAIRTAALGVARGLDSAVYGLRAAANDFRGEDVHTMDLEDIPLGGVRWDRSTRWPPSWQDRVRWASMPDRDGVLVIHAQPYGMAVEVTVDA